MFDLDDTLLDSTLATFTYHNLSNPFLEGKGLGSRDVHKNFQNMSWYKYWYTLPTSFWANIPKMLWCDMLIDLAEKTVGKDNVFFLTSPIQNAACTGGKMEWVMKNYSKYGNNLIIAHRKHIVTDTESLLIDDSYKNEAKFAACGKSNNFLLFPAFQNNLYAQVEEMYKDPTLAVKLVQNKIDNFVFINK